MGESPKQINQSPKKLQTEGSVAELVKSFDSSGFSKVLTTSATKLATKFDEELNAAIR